jgi:23S rRNA (cytosine1962-C5)-methyltransferase
MIDLKGKSLGSGLWNSKSQIAWRRYSHRLVSLDGPLLDELILTAIRRRNNKPVGRLIWSEADNLPGLVVDRYNDLLTVQALTFGIDQRLPKIIDCLQRELKPREIVIRNDAPVRKLEGLEMSITTASGKSLEPCWMKVGDVEMLVDLMGGQKTGMYLDQIEQHARIAQLAKGRRVLDTFCNQGGFGLACARAGATSVLGLDSSEEAIQAARQAAERNQTQCHF